MPRIVQLSESIFESLSSDFVFSTFHYPTLPTRRAYNQRPMRTWFVLTQRLARITVWAQAKGRGGTRTPLEEFQGFPLSCWASYSRHTVPRACEGNGFALQRLVIAIKNMGWNGKQMCDHHHHHHNNYHSHHAQEVLRALLFVIFISQK